MTTSANCGSNKRSTSTSSNTKEDLKNRLDVVLTEQANTTEASENILLNAHDEELKSPRLSPYSLKNIMKWRFRSSSKATPSKNDESNEKGGVAAFLGGSMRINRPTDYNNDPDDTVNGSSESKHWFSFKRKASIKKNRSKSVKETTSRSKYTTNHKLLEDNQFKSANKHDCSSSKDGSHNIVEQNRKLLTSELSDFFENRKLKRNENTCQSTCDVGDKTEGPNIDTSVDANLRVYSKIYDEPWCSIFDTTAMYAQTPSYLDLASTKRKVFGVTKVFDTNESKFTKYNSGGTTSLESFRGSAHVTTRMTTAVQTDNRNSTYVTAKVTSAVHTHDRNSTHVAATKVTTATQTDDKNSVHVTAKGTVAVQTDDMAYDEHYDFETSLKKLSIQEVGDILEVLDLTQYKHSFKNEQIDGDILSRLSCDDLITELTLKKLEALRLYSYVKTGHVPK